MTIIHIIIYNDVIGLHVCMHVHVHKSGKAKKQNYLTLQAYPNYSVLTASTSV